MEEPVDYMQFFEEFNPTEAQRHKTRLHMDAALRRYVDHVIASIERGNEVRVPSAFPLAPKVIKAAIRNVAKVQQRDLMVWFEKATDGFFVRQATERERERAIARGHALTLLREERRRAQEEEQRAATEAEHVADTGGESEEPVEEEARETTRRRRRR